MKASYKEAKKQRNIEAHQRRSLELKAKQERANQLRKEFGYTAVEPDKVIQQHDDYLLAEAEKLAESIRLAKENQQEVQAKQFIHTVLCNTGSTGNIIRRWLNVRINRSTKEVMALIHRFLNTQGNELHKAAVENAASIKTKAA